MVASSVLICNNISFINIFSFLLRTHYYLCQKSVLFSHSVISPNQLLQNSKTLLIFSYPSEAVSKYFSLRILCILFKVLYTVKNLIFRTDRTDKTMKTLIRLLRIISVCHSICLISTSFCNENPNCSILGYFQYLFQVFQFLDVST